MRQDGRWQSTSTLADLIRLAQSGKCGDDGGLVASGWRPAVASPDEVRGYAKDAAPRGKHAVEKARWGEGAFDEMYDSAYDSADDSESDAAADAAPLKGKRKRAKGAKQRLAQALGEGLVFWCALCDMAKPLQSLKAIEAHRKGKKSCVRRPGPVQPYSSRPAIQTCAGPTQTNPAIDHYVGCRGQPSRLVHTVHGTGGPSHRRTRRHAVEPLDARLELALAHHGEAVQRARLEELLSPEGVAAIGAAGGAGAASATERGHVLLQKARCRSSEAAEGGRRSKGKRHIFPQHSTSHAPI